MGKDYEKKLSNLKARRRGTSTSALSERTWAFDSATPTITEEAYEKRSANKATRYALGSMQEVDPAYTKNSYIQGDRVKNQLASGLPNTLPVTFEYQGSVPLNVHIKGASDVDLLVLRSEFLTVALDGIKNQRGEYGEWSGDGPVQLLSILRNESIKVLEKAFLSASVDSSGSKSIAISGGSLTRKVDVVPSHWYDSVDYQGGGNKKDRGVCILDFHKQETVKNFPFLHMHHIELKDSLTNGGAKKAIRLLKTLKADSDNSSAIGLNSYDIASLVWNIPNATLFAYSWNELSLIATLKTELTSFVADKPRAMKLRTPDGTRYVLDSEEKYTSLIRLYIEVTQLAEAVSQELCGDNVEMSTERVLSILRSATVG